MISGLVGTFILSCEVLAMGMHPSPHIPEHYFDRNTDADIDRLCDISESIKNKREFCTYSLFQIRMHQKSSAEVLHHWNVV